MREIDEFIDTGINRLSGPQGQLTSNFYVDLRSYQTRITQNLENHCISLCNSRGITAQRIGDGLSITVDLNSCFLNSAQAQAYNIALSYTRNVHGNML